MKFGVLLQLRFKEKYGLIILQKSNILVKLYKMYEILLMRKIYEIIHLTNNSYK